MPGTPVARLEPVIGTVQYARLLTAAARFRDKLGGRTVWNVNSTAVGGGVAEMLQVLVGYIAGLDIAVRWAVIGGDPDFFAITKRLHNQIHGQAGAGPLSSADASHYGQVLDANADELLRQVRPGDIVLLHDPQTAGLAAALAALLLLEIVVWLASNAGLSDLTLRDVGVLGLAFCVMGSSEQRLVLTS